MDLNENDSSRTPYLWAVFTFVFVMVIYYATLAPTTAFWDTSEYIAAAKVLGIPHPPGNPLFTLLAHVFGLLPLAAEYAKRINLFAAVTSSVGAAFWFLVAERWCRNILAVRGPRIAAAFAGVLASATAWTVWNQSTVNEKVYTVSLMSIAIICWCAVKWADSPPGDRRDRWLIGAVYLLALTSTNHQMGLLAAPVVGIYILATDWRVLLKPRFLVACAVVAIIGVSLNYIYLPIRAAQYPPINEGEPIGFFSKALFDVLGRVQYGKPKVFDRQASFIGQLSMYWQYWSWQWGRDLGRILFGPVTALFTVLTLGGAWTLIKRDKRAGYAAIALLVTLTLVLIFYLNFKYGFSYQPNNLNITQDMREVRERDYFFVASFAFAGVLIAVAFAALIRSIGDWLGDRVPDNRRYAMATPVLVLALIPLLGNRVTASRAHETLPRDFAIDILESVAPYGILITAGDNDTFPLWFAQEVLGVRKDVTLANLSLMNTDWHLRQLRRRKTPDFDPSKAASIWRPGTDTSAVPLWGGADSGWVRPTTPVLSFTIPQLDSLPDFMRVPEGNTAQIGPLTLHFGQDYLTKSDFATLLLIRDNLGKRPIYFSWSAGGYPDNTLGLQPYLITEGLVRRLNAGPIQPDSNRIVFSGDIGYLDVPRTRQLVDSVYHWKAAARQRPRGWVDVPSISILHLYEIVYDSWARVLVSLGDSAEAVRPDSIARAIERNIH